MSSNSDLNIVSITDEIKSQNSKYTLSKFEHDLFNEENDVAEKVIRIKRVSSPNKGEKWKIFEDTKNVFTLEGDKLTNKEKTFLRSVEGINFLLAQYKSGFKSLNALKNEMKKNIK